MRAAVRLAAATAAGIALAATAVAPATAAGATPRITLVSCTSGSPYLATVEWRGPDPDTIALTTTFTDGSQRTSGAIPTAPSAARANSLTVPLTYSNPPATGLPASVTFQLDKTTKNGTVTTTESATCS